MKDYEGNHGVYLLEVETDPDPGKSAERLLAYMVVFRDPSDADEENEEEEEST